VNAGRQLEQNITATSSTDPVRRLEDMPLEEIEKYREHYEKLAMTAREKLRGGHADTGTPEITIR
jgi:hypothetical protein